MKKHQGVSRALLEKLPQLPSQFSVAQAARLLPQFPTASIASAASYLKAQGYLTRGSFRGMYVKVTEHGATNAPETVIIDELLAAMARAEPIIRKWQRIQEAISNV